MITHTCFVQSSTEAGFQHDSDYVKYYRVVKTGSGERDKSGYMLVHASNTTNAI